MVADGPAVYSWGNGSEGQLGYGGSDNVSTPGRLEFFNGRNVKGIAAGARHTLVLADSGAVYAFGNNDHGQLGHTKRRLRPEVIDYLEAFRITQVAAGARHSVAVTDDGHVLTWGAGDRGQLGQGLDAVTAGSVPKPRFVKALQDRRIVQVACGDAHTLALSETGGLYAWGDNTHGQLGLGTFSMEHTPQRVKALQGHPVVKLACGASHSVVVTVSGSVWAWGSNAFGQLGLGEEPKKLRPTRVAGLDGKHAVDVACGEAHTAALTAEGRVFLFGAGSNGQLGHDSDQPVLFPKVVVDLLGAPSALVACGRRHTLVYQPDQHRIYSFGLNGSGQLGDGTAKSVSVPVLVKSLAGHRVHLLAAGGDQSFVVTEPDAAGAAAVVVGASPNGAETVAMATDVERPSGASLKRRSAPGSPRAEHSDEEATLHDGAGPAGSSSDDRPERGARSSQSAKVQAVSSPPPAPPQSQAPADDAGRPPRSPPLVPGSPLARTTEWLPALPAPPAVSSSAAASPPSSAAMETDGEAPTATAPTPTPAAAAAATLQALGEAMAAAVAQGAAQLVGQAGAAGAGADAVVPGALDAVVADDSDESGEGTPRVAAVSAPEAEDVPECFSPPNRPPNVNTIAMLSYPYLRTLCRTHSGRLGHVQRILEAVYGSVACMNASYLASNHRDCSPEISGLDMEQVRRAYAFLWGAADPVLATTVGHAAKKLANSLLQLLPSEPETLRAVLILLENPLLLSPAMYHVVIQQVATLLVKLPDAAWSILGEWIGRLAPPFAYRIVQIFTTFMSFLITARTLELDQSIVSCAIVLSRLFQINERFNVLPIKSFYIKDLAAKLDLAVDYQNWLLSPNTFSFCRYPFLLTPVRHGRPDWAVRAPHHLLTRGSAGPRVPYIPPVQDLKVRVLHLDSARQMSNQITSEVQHSILFQQEARYTLQLQVRRGVHLVDDTLSQLAIVPPSDYKKPLIVVFEGEEGLDEGGVKKEFYRLVVERILMPDFGAFVYEEESRTVNFNRFGTLTTEQMRLLGALVGIGVYNACLLDIEFAPYIYGLLLGREPTMRDLAQYQPTLARSLQQLLDYDEPDLADVFALTYAVTVRNPTTGEMVTHELRKGGADIPVTVYNRADYVQRYIRYLLVESIEPFFRPFKEGLNMVLEPGILKLFHPREVEFLIRGSPSFRFDQLEKLVEYRNGYSPDHPVIKNFWQAFHSLSTDLKRKFLLFLTGSDRVPLAGLSSLKFVIQRTGDPNALPAAHTCYNILDLPEYPDLETLQSKLVYAITNTEGFGLV